MSLLPNLTASRGGLGGDTAYLFPTLGQFNSLSNALSTVNISTSTGAGVSVSEPTANNFVFSNALSNAGGISFVSVPGSATLGLSNAGVVGLAAGSGISVSGATGNITVANTGVLSVSAGSNVVVGGTASAPVINATTPISTTFLLDQWSSSPLNVATPAGGAITNVSSFTGLTPGKTYLVSCTAGLSCSVNNANATMDLALSLPGVGELPSIASYPCATTGTFAASAATVLMPAGKTQLNVIVSEYSATPTTDIVSAQVENLSITQLN